MKHKFLALLFITSMGVFGQVNSGGETSAVGQKDLQEEPKTYVLKDIVIDGVKKYTPDQILRFTGLSRGESIEFPSQKVSYAVTKLWETELFSDVEVYVESIEGNAVVLKFYLKDLKELGEIKFTGKGIRKSQNEKLIKDNKLEPGTKITQDLVASLKYNVPLQYKQKGHSDAKISIDEKVNAQNPDMVDWVISVDKGKKVKINRIDFEGNETVSDSKLRNKGFKETKKRRIFKGIMKPSRLVPEKYEEDKKNLVGYYQSLGFRDASVVSDSISRDNRGYNIDITVSEGKKYYINEITFVGNTVYSTETLQRILGYKKGDIYDVVGFNKKVGEDGGKEDDSDIKSVYMNNGYLFSQVIPVEKSVEGDQINLEIRIREGSRATWNRVTWSGNTTTFDHVILRALRTKPGDLFSKTKIKRSFFDLAGMQFFDPQQIGQDIKPNDVDNTVDIHWTVVEKGSSQISLQAGYGGGSFIGTLGLTFSNFSLKNFLKFKNFNPIPQGDGQTLSLQAQAGRNYQTYSIGFVEPWLFGTKPTALSVNTSYSRVRYDTTYEGVQKLNIISASVGLSRQLKWPDDYFHLYTGLSYQLYDFNNYPFQFGTETVYDGKSQTFSFNLGLSRNSAGFDPIFPTSGSNLSLEAKLTPPYSLFQDKDYSTMEVTEKYKWLEFYKIKFKFDAYSEIIGKLVLRSAAEGGFLNGYNSDLGAPPFERFYMGGTGLTGGRYDGRELVPLRGYEDASNYGGTRNDITPLGGGTIYNRFTLELRYPISMGNSAKIWALGFVEGGNVWNDYSKYNPFSLKRSVGAGIRVYMGAFGLIGFDFAYGFDNTLGNFGPSGNQTHFLMNQTL